MQFGAVCFFFIIGWVVTVMTCAIDPNVIGDKIRS